MNKIFQVIEIVNHSTILINAGANQKVKVGDLVRVIEKGDDVIDPDTKESLGTFDYIKDELEIVRVYPAFSVCKKIHRENINKLSPFSNLVTTKTSIKSLNVNKEQISNRNIKGNPVISIGDLVVVIWLIID